jgi:hypothetical protein
MASLRAALAVFAIACSAPRAPEPGPPPAQPAPQHPAAVSPPPGVAAADGGSTRTPGATAPVSSAFSFQRVLEAPVHSLAFGEKARVAALGDDAWLDRGKGFEKMPKPPRPTAEVGIYFGRDNQPRLMGFERAPNGETSVYLRWLKDAWQNGASEIARLAGVPGPMYGVLGWADPEVVCKRGDQCIIKRVSGWKFVPAPPNLPDVVLCEGQAWAFEQGQLWVLEKDGFRPVNAAPAFTRIGAVWGTSPAEVWVADAGRNVVQHLAGAAWSEQRAPIEGARALWAANPGEVWLVGDGGAARFDGKAWSVVSGAPKGALVVSGREAEVWIAGTSGVWRGTKAP